LFQEVDTARPLLSLLPHRAKAPFRAISDRSRTDNFAARAFPPLSPPSLPNATAAGFFLRSVIRFAIGISNQNRSPRREIKVGLTVSKNDRLYNASKTQKSEVQIE
jgi:hypothetical protein